MLNLDPQSRTAFNVKRQSRVEDSNSAESEFEATSPDIEAKGLWGIDYDAVPVGNLTGLESIRLRWIDDLWFEFIPKKAALFSFTRSNGEIVTPGRMFTDGSSIPRFFWLKKKLSPWTYGPASLLHDWEFDLHHCKRTPKTFEEVRDTMMEGLKTLMENETCPRDVGAFRKYYLGINSIFARRAWNRHFDTCPLPPDGDE